MPCQERPVLLAFAALGALPALPRAVQPPIAPHRAPRAPAPPTRGLCPPGRTTLRRPRRRRRLPRPGFRRGRAPAPRRSRCLIHHLLRSPPCRPVAPAAPIPAAPTSPPCLLPGRVC